MSDRMFVDLFRAMLVLSVCFVGRRGVACVIRVTHLHRVDDRWWIVWIWRTADVLLLSREAKLTSRKSSKNCKLTDPICNVEN